LKERALPATGRTDDHPFLHRPHRTLLAMSLPVLLSLTAEPLTGLVDTAFVARLGTEALSGLGVGTMALSSVFWVFSFLGIGTQTEVAQAMGKQDVERTTRFASLALFLGLGIGLLLILLGLPVVPAAARLMGATGNVQDQAAVYMQWRLLGAPAILVTVASFGTLRGLQDMRTPLAVAAGVNGLNVLLDALLIFGPGPFPALGILGAALASSLSQWVGALWVFAKLYRRLGCTRHIRITELWRILQIGRDLFIRTGLLTLFLLLCTRLATRIGPSSGAAHQAIRQFWVFTFLFLDTFAICGQSMIGYFVGSDRLADARYVAVVVCKWSVVTGLVLTLVMLFFKGLFEALLVPAAALGVFSASWNVAAFMQPISALAFATDGIHWGTGDFRYLRNVVLLATAVGTLALAWVDETRTGALLWVWLITAGWLGVRAVFGVVRIWPGMGHPPLRH
jgi:MATE family multidrug resistance protein